MYNARLLSKIKFTITITMGMTYVMSLFPPIELCHLHLHSPDQPLFLVQNLIVCNIRAQALILQVIRPCNEIVVWPCKTSQSSLSLLQHNVLPPYQLPMKHTKQSWNIKKMCTKCSTMIIIHAILVILIICNVGCISWANLPLPFLFNKTRHVCYIHK